ncbi:MAG TPA: hypothetical protein VGO37_20140 [Steroidobacteraceae bacterium]|nr:hypothetical protein [Steroidobacteraceae bacterium]
MSDRIQTMDEGTINCGLLMESAQAHQRLAEDQLQRLHAHTQDLDVVVRDEIRRTLIEELQMLTVESKRATEALKRVRRTTALRGVLASLASAILCTCIPIAIIRWVLPSEPEIAALRTRHAELSASIAILDRRGGRADLRHCGEPSRLCVRVDRKAPAYGEKADYFVLAGY